MEKKQNTSNIIIINVAEIFNMLIRRIPVILICALVFALAGAGYANMSQTVPMYYSTAKLYVTGVATVAPSAAGFSLGQQVISNYIEIMESRPVLEQVIENLGLNMSYSELKSCISTNQPEGTAMLEVSISFPDPEWAKLVVDELIVDSAAYALEIMRCSPPTVYEEAAVSVRPYNDYGTNMVMYSVLGFVAGGAFAVFGLLVIYFASTKFKTPDQIRQKLKMETLAVIPDSKTKQANYVENAYCGFYSRLVFATKDDKVIAFFSCGQTEKQQEFVSCAADMIQACGKKVVCVDTSQNYNPTNSEEKECIGLFDYLSDKAEISDIICKADGQADKIYSGGNVVNSSALLSGDSFDLLLKKLREKYDYVLIQTEPVEYAVDAIIVGKKAEAGVIVVSGDVTKTYRAKRAVETIRQNDVRILGVVLKDISLRKSGKYFIKNYGKYFGVYNKR